MINYIDIGKGTPILFLHGLGQTLNAWKPQKELSDTCRLIMIDLRGHGDSEHINTDITLENMAKDVIELIEHLKISSCYIVGLSLGGLVAQEIYRQREDLCMGLILCNTTFYIPSLFAERIVKSSERLFNEDRNKLIEHIVRKSVHNPIFHEEAKQSFHISDVYLECAKSGVNYNYFPVLLRVKVPTLLIGSRFDSTTPLYNLFLMKWMIPKAKTVIVNSGHLSNFECRDEVNAAIRNFIN
jgi:pimeloyl-ACP methyl ester carboxylesterase